jgi:hypothetical protein
MAQIGLTQQVAAKQKWLTLSASEHHAGKAGGKMQEMLSHQVQYPTPTSSEWKGAALDRAPGTDKYRGNLCEKVELDGGGVTREDGKVLRLNPDWTEWLMGWPIGWTDLEPITDLDWRDWKTDPADELPPKDIGTPRATEAIRSDEFRKGRTPSPEEYIIEAGAGTGSIPRVATGIKNRVARLKAIGNGQVPACAALAWRVLTGDD